MNKQIDSKQLVLAALYYYRFMEYKTDISYDDVAAYKDRLEQENNIKLDIITVDQNDYSNYYQTTIENGTFFHYLNSPKEVVQKEYVLDYDRINAAEEIFNQISYIKQYKQDIQQINIEQTFKEGPNVNIDVNDVYKIFMFYYRLLCAREISTEVLNTSLEEIKKLFRSNHYLYVCNQIKDVPDKNHKFLQDNDNIVIDINDICGYRDEINQKSDGRSIDLIEQVVVYYIMNKNLDVLENNYTK